MCTPWPGFQNLAPSKSTWTPPSLNYFRLNESQLDLEESYGLRPNLMKFDQVGQVAVTQWATRPIKSYLPRLKTLLSTITSSSSCLRNPRMPPHNSPLPFFEFNHLYLIIWWHFFLVQSLEEGLFFPFLMTSVFTFFHCFLLFLPPQPSSSISGQQSVCFWGNSMEIKCPIHWKP